MAYPRKTTAASNTIKLNLDPDTFDRLKARATAAKDTMERTAYRLLQQLLAAEIPAAASPAEPEPAAFDMSGFSVFNRGPEGGS